MLTQQKRIIGLIVLILSMFLLTGCMEGTIHITVNKDGSADLEYKVGLDSALISMTPESQNPFIELRQNAEKAGFTVSNYTENGMTGVIARKHVKHLKDIPVTKDFTTEFDGKGERLFTIDDTLFKEQLRIDSAFDLTDMKADSEGQSAELQQAVLSKIKINFMLTLPVKSKENNASKIENGGKTLTWQLLPGQNNPIKMQATLVKTTNIKIVLGLVGILILALLILIWRISRRIKRQEEEQAH